jgi:hypothetical protein
MANNLGFGEPPSKPKASKRAKERKKAATQYDKMKSAGLPEYEVYIRIQDKKQWYPVGVVAVKRSNQVNRAIFDNQEQLLQGAFRLYPILRKHQDRLEYGYRYKEFKDEPVQLAEMPKVSAAGMKSAIASLKSRFSSLLQQ